MVVTAKIYFYSKEKLTKYLLPTYQYYLNICISLQLRPHTLTCSVIEYATHPLHSNIRGCGTGVSHCQGQSFVGTVSVSSLDCHSAYGRLSETAWRDSFYD